MAPGTWNQRVVVLGLLALATVPSGRAAQASDIFLGARMPYAAFDRLPATTIRVGGSAVAVGIAPGPLEPLTSSRKEPR